MRVPDLFAVPVEKSLASVILQFEDFVFPHFLLDRELFLMKWCRSGPRNRCRKGTPREIFLGRSLITRAYIPLNRISIIKTFSSRETYRIVVTLFVLYRTAYPLDSPRNNYAFRNLGISHLLDLSILYPDFSLFSCCFGQALRITLGHTYP